MKQSEAFTPVGIRPAPPPKKSAGKRRGGVPYLSLILLGLILLGCLGAEVLMTRDPAYLDIANASRAPDGEFLFGTDTLGRDIFSCIWYGGRVSLVIGLLAASVSTLIAVVYGSISGIAPAWLDHAMMRLTEIFLSVPTLLVILFVQAILGTPNVLSLALVIGVTSWCSIAKVVRTEVRQMRNSEYVIAARCMGAGFFHILRRHLAPNFISSISFMVVMNLRAAITAEATLSFLGMGLPLETVSWGSMLSLAENALMSAGWWIILIPGAFLLTVLMCMTNIAAWLQTRISQRERNL